MIIDSLQLDPFAGVSDKKISFRKGLNVVLGPNEAGKSTLLNALRLVLFVPTNCTQRVFRQEIVSFMPLSGGDTIRVGLGFRIGKKKYSVTKSWGYSRQDSELRLPGGGVRTNAQDVQNELQNLLTLSRGTYDSVLLGAQSRLGHTHDSLDDGSPAMQDLASILRKAVFETEGVSIEQLGNACDGSFYYYFSRWDMNDRRPEGSRQIENPWKREVGRILSAYYNLERLKQGLLDAQEYESELDDLIKAIREHSTELDHLQAYIEKNRKVVADAIQRQILVAQKDALKIEERALLDASKLWLKTIDGRKSMQNDLKTLEKDRKALEREMKRVQAYEDNKARLEKHKRASKKKGDLQKTRSALLKMKVIGEEDYEELKGLNAQLMTLETSLQAGKLALTIRAKKVLSLRVSNDLERETEHRLGARESLELSAAGQIRVDHDDWALKIKSGDIAFDDIKESIDGVSKRYGASLKRLGVSDIDEAGKAYDSYQKQCKLFASLQEQLDEILDGEAYEELERLIKKVSRAEVPSRGSGLVGKQLGSIENEISNTERSIESANETLSQLKKEYHSQDGLSGLLVNQRAELKRTEIELKKLTPLPKSVKDPDKLVEEYNSKQRAAQEREEELTKLRIEKIQKEAQAPAETREEVESQLKQAALDFSKAEREGEAISEIRDTFREVEAEMDSQTLDPWLRELGEVLKPLTANRYNQIDLSEAEPGRALRADGLAIPFVLLSVGTKVGLGLALRLSMARHFLKDSEGFLVLDDPLVDMDPDRQSAAAKIVQGFAQEKQVVVMTCQPAHADLLGGQTIAL